MMKKPNLKKLFTVSVLALLLVSLFGGLGVWQIKPAYATALNSFTDGFESADASAWTGTSITGGGAIDYVQDPRFRGSYAANCTNAGSNTTSYPSDFYEDLNASNAVYARGYFYFDTNVFPFEDSSDRITMIMWGLVGSDRVGSAQVENVSGTLKWVARFINAQGYVTLFNSTPTVTEQTWWCIEFYASIDASNGAVGMWVNGTQIIYQTGLNTTRYGNINKVHFGNPWPNMIDHNCSIYVDSCVVSDSYIGVEPPETPEQEFYLNDDFETSEFPSANWTTITESSNCNVTRQSSVKHLGSWAVEHEVANTTTSQMDANLYRIFSTNYTELYYRGYFMFGTGSLSQLQDVNDRIGLMIVAPLSGWSKSAVYARNISGVGIRFALSYLVGSVSSYTYSDVTPVENTWYCIEAGIFLSDTVGWGKLWVNGVLKVNAQNLNNTRGNETTICRLRTVYTINEGVAHNMSELTVYSDDFKVSNQYIGTDGGTNPPPIVGAWAIFSSMANKAYIKAMFDAQSIDYVEGLDTNITSLAYIQDADGLVVWYDAAYDPSYNVTAIQEYAKTHVVICDLYDFAVKVYSGIGSGNIVTIDTGATNTTETFLTDYGSKQWTNTSMFHTGDVVEWHWGNGTNKVRAITTTALSGYSNITLIARRDTANTTLLQMNGTTAVAGFYAMDLFCIRDNTLFNGIYQLLPAIWNSGTTTDIGQHAEWLQSGLYTPTYAAWQSKWWAFTDANKDIMNQTKIGTSMDGKDWNITIIGFGSEYLEADADMHGGEKQPIAALYRFMEEVTWSYRTGGVWATRLNQVKLILIMSMNPDGYSTYGRENKNGVNLNRDMHETAWYNGSSSGKPYVWYGNFSQQESQNFKAVIDTYQPVLTLTFHEGREWEKNVVYMSSVSGQTSTSKSFETYLFNGIQSYWTSTINHWGTYTDHGSNYHLHETHSYLSGMVSSAPTGYMTPYYPAHQYDACSFLVESVVCTGDYGTREQLYACEWYGTVVSQLFLRFSRDKTNNFITYATKPIKSSAWNGVAGTYTVVFNNTGYASMGTTNIYVGTRGKPLYVKINNVNATENTDWTWASTTHIVTVVGSDNVTLAYIEGGVTVTVTIASPINATYTVSSVPVQISASGGTIDKIWWNCTYTNGTVAYANTVYTIATSMTLGNGSYIFNARANNTLGEWDEATVTFTVAISADTYTLTLTVTNPQNTTYTSSSIPVQLGTSGNDTNPVITYNAQFSNGTWVYGTNQTYSVITIMVINENATNIRFCCHVIGDNLAVDYKEVMFTVEITTTPPSPPEAPPVTPPLPVPPVTVSWTLYMRSDTHTIDNQLGYVLRATQTFTYAYVTLEKAGSSGTTHWGWRFWIVYKDNSTQELTGGTPVAQVSRTSTGSGLQSATYTPDKTSFGLMHMTVALKADLYMWFESDTPTLEATFISNNFLSRAVLNSTWTVYTYTARYVVEDTLTAEFWWGTSTYNSRIASFSYHQPYSWEAMYENLGNKDLVGFFLTAGLWYFGTLFYGVGFALGGFMLYMRYKSFAPLLILLILLGGVGGALLKPLIPNVGFEWGWVLVMLGVAGLFYKLVHGASHG